MDEHTDPRDKLRDALPKAFHAKDGLRFLRLREGSVVVDSPGGAVILDGATWCSAVAFVSARGETGQTFDAATALHDGRPAPDQQ